MRRRLVYNTNLEAEYDVIVNYRGVVKRGKIYLHDTADVTVPENAYILAVTLNHLRSMGKPVCSSQVRLDDHWDWTIEDDHCKLVKS